LVSQAAQLLTAPFNSTVDARGENFEAGLSGWKAAPAVPVARRAHAAIAVGLCPRPAIGAGLSAFRRIGARKGRTGPLMADFPWF